MALGDMVFRQCLVNGVAKWIETTVSRVDLRVTLISAIFIHQSPLAALLHLQALHLSDWIMAVAGTV